MEEDRPFRTESCGDCSNFRWGHHTLKGFIIDWQYGENAGCHNRGQTFELDRDPGTEFLTPEEALDYYGPEGNYCKRFTGQKPHTLEEIQKYISEHL
ncbi:MAG: hypothetical protein KKF50_00135 [Nanoarchaeota archaeon]|nr:hypothetical protein [Nanoarchaeota archaeon]